MMRDFRADLARYRALGNTRREIALNPAVWCICWYRLGRWIYGGTAPFLLRPLLKGVHLLGATILDALMQMRLNVRAQIGPGLLIAHVGGISVHPDAVIGRHCDLAHHVTIGTAGLGRRGVPRIGDGVYIGTGAVIVGKVRIGSGARIAANSLVMSSVPAGATVLGVPATVVWSGNRTAGVAAPEPAAAATEVQTDQAEAGAWAQV